MKLTAFVCLLVAGLLVSCAGEVVDLNEDNFEDLTGEGTWLISFVAPECEFCDTVSSTFTEVAETLSGSVMLGRVDGRTNENLAKRFEVTKYPALRLIKDGEYTAIEDHPPSDVVVLTTSNFDEFLGDGRAWFVEFYAPWCGHCQRLHPVWEKLATTLKGGNVGIGKVEATSEDELAQRYEIRGFPTIKFIRDGVSFDYNGGRSLADLIEYLEKMSQPAIHDVTAETLAELKERSLVTFVLAGGSDEAKEMFARVARQYQGGELGFALASEGVKDGLFAMAGDDEEVFEETLSEEALSEFVKANKLPFFPELGPHNYPDVMSMGKKVVIALVKPSDEEKTAEYTKLMRTIGREMKKDLSFCWLDADRWEKYIAGQFGQHPYPRFVVIDEDDGNLYVDDAAEAETITSFLKQVIDGTATPMKKEADKEPERQEVKKEAEEEEEEVKELVPRIRACMRDHVEMAVGGVALAGLLLGFLLRGCCKCSKAQQEKKKAQTKKEK